MNGEVLVVVPSMDLESLVMAGLVVNLNNVHLDFRDVDWKFVRDVLLIAMNRNACFVMRTQCRSFSRYLYQAMPL